jgi:uncharacterized membrane protein
MPNDDENCLHCEILALRDTVLNEGRQMMIDGNQEGSARALAASMLLSAAAAICEEDDDEAMNAIQNAVGVMKLNENPGKDCETCAECPAIDICPMRDPKTNTPREEVPETELPN